MTHFEIRLADAIEALRGELQAAMDAGDGKQLRFHVEGLELEFQTVVTREASGKGSTKGGIKFWLLSGEGSTELAGKIGSSRVQTVRMKLKPTTADGSKPQPLSG